MQLAGWVHEARTIIVYLREKNAALSVPLPVAGGLSGALRVTADLVEEWERAVRYDT